MKEHPMLMKGPLIIATLNDSKTQTRRLPTSATARVDGKHVSPKAWKALDLDWDHAQINERAIRLPERRFSRWHTLTPKWEVGDHLWLRETWSPVHYSALPEYPSDFCAFTWDECIYGPLDRGARDLLVCYHADGEDHNPAELYPCIGTKGKVLRKAEIRWKPSIHMPRWASRIDLEVLAVRAERIQDITRKDAAAEGICGASFKGYQTHRWPEQNFHTLWDSINASRGFAWSSNRPVFVLTYKRIRP